MNNTIKIRRYQTDDAESLCQIYYNTIHSINAKDYSEEQVNAWAPWSSLQKYDGWLEKLERIKPYVALSNDKIVGFAEFEPNGHIDCFYVHHEYQGCGVGTSLMNEIDSEASVKKMPRIFAEVSITAKPFFLNKGFEVVKEQVVSIRGVQLNNFVMEKWL